MKIDVDKPENKAFIDQYNVVTIPLLLYIDCHEQIVHRIDDANMDEITRILHSIRQESQIADLPQCTEAIVNL